MTSTIVDTDTITPADRKAGPMPTPVDISDDRISFVRLVFVEVRKMVDTRAGLWMLIAMAAVGFLIGLTFIPAGLILSFGSIALVAFLIMQKRTKCEAEVAAAEAAREAAKTVSIDIYRETAAEWVDVKIVYSEEDVKESNMLELVEGWPK